MMRAGVGWLTPWLDERPKGYLFKRLLPPAGEFHKWVDWELPCYLTVVILGIRLNAKPNLTLQTWPH
uniref:Uncharacterized protein n=1 Tax=Oryza glumipatula TaxID=40148 RepID=A0A0E0A9S9_9ORYZ